MIMKLLQLTNLLLSALVGGLYWGPWLALTRSLRTFDANVFLAIVQRLNQNLAPVMTVLTPLALLSTLPTLISTSGSQPTTFYLTLAGFVCFLVALIVTVRIEVPIVMQMTTWRASALPPNWTEVRDRWGHFHVVRVVAGVAGLVFLLAGVLA